MLACLTEGDVGREAGKVVVLTIAHESQKHLGPGRGAWPRRTISKGAINSSHSVFDGLFQAIKYEQNIRVIGIV